MKKKEPKVAGGGLSVAEIAKLSDVSLSRVYAELSQGRSAFEIIATAQRRKQQEAAQATVLPADMDAVTGVNGGAPVNGFPVNGGVPSYSASLARKEAALAELRHVELLEKRRLLVPVAYMRKWGVDFLVETRDELEKGPGELQDALAAESDPLKCNAIVRAWVERVIAKFYKLETLWGPPLPEPPEAA